jgi:ribonuclease HI
MIDIYTDGSCHGNPGKGGWGIFAIHSITKEIIEKNGYQKWTTNNQMELMAVIQAILTFPNQTINIYTDSIYVYKGITIWIKNWKKNNWTSSLKKPIKNQDLWIQLDSLNHSSINYYWIKGHSNHFGNDRADFLANQAISLIDINK